MTSLSHRLNVEEKKESPGWAYNKYDDLRPHLYVVGRSVVGLFYKAHKVKFTI